MKNVQKVSDMIICAGLAADQYRKEAARAHKNNEMERYQELRKKVDYFHNRAIRLSGYPFTEMVRI